MWLIVVLTIRRFVFDYEKLHATFEEGLSERIMQDLRNRFVTGNWAAANKVTDSDDEGGEDALPAGADDDEVYGDFEDLETGEKFTGGAESADDDEDDEGDDDEEEEDEDAIERRNEEIDNQLREVIARHISLSNEKCVR